MAYGSFGAYALFSESIIIFCLPFIIFWISAYYIMAIINSKKRGRPATGRAKDGVLFIRLPKSERARVKAGVESLLNSRAGETIGVNYLQVVGNLPEQSPITYTSPDVKSLLDNVDELTKEVELLKSRLEKCARATEDDKCRRWMGMYDKLLESVKAKHPDEGW